MGDPATVQKVTLSLDLGFFSMDTEWVADPRERQAAWELYVELATRVATQPLDPDTGMAREALDSLHALFETTRAILRAAGPGVGTSERSLGYLAISVLNQGLRPFLSRWHPRLAAWEHGRGETISPVAHERAWEQDLTLRGELEALRIKMWMYASALADIAGIKRRRT
ncbi:MAG: hypothetical protein JW940_17650 [Polyangiaceae bacterium]|nr:hypothetical protein [Polyangiaceae bacterium]